MKYKGLTEKEIIESRKKYGNNAILKQKNHSFLQLFIESLGDPIIKILIVALCVKVIFLFKDFDFFETIGIMASILIASLVSSISEYGSEAAFKKLEEESSKIKVKVIRDYKNKIINIEEVVVKDIITLNSGDKIPADGHLIKGSVSIDESSINGETKYKSKNYNDNLYRGTTVMDGEGLMLVDKVGSNTMYGNIAKELQEKVPISPLKQRLTILAQQISKIGYLGAFLVSLSYLFSKIIIENNFNMTLITASLNNFKLLFSYLLHALTLAVTVIVVSVPEGLPLMITLVLSSNMRRMLKNNVLVRKLVGIETAGNLNYLLTDKTGTLTKGKLQVTKIITSNLTDILSYNSISNLELKKTIYNSLYFNNSSKKDPNGIAVGGNNTDQCLLNFIPEETNTKTSIIESIPFDSQKKYSLVTLNEGEKITYIKGAPEMIINNCTKRWTPTNKLEYFTNRNVILEILKKNTQKGYRVIALALSNTYHLTKQLNNLTFIGLVLIKDEVRAEAKESINIIKNAGITPVMITGDDKDTAISIAKEVGIITSQNDIILTSKELNSMSDEEIISIHKQIKVIARALPSDKSKLVKILRDLNYVVGMTGDGVNDAPALKKADVGFAMGSGTEVAKEASDIVILDDNIKSITKAILYGRTIFKSIRKFIIFQLSVNICAVTISILGPFIGIETPITIVQMLWINMIMDTLAGIAFSYEPPLMEYMLEKPLNKKTRIINKYMKNEIFFSGLYQAIICILFLKLPLIKNIIRTDINNKYLMTAYFTLFVFMGVFNSLNARTTRINVFANLKDNKPFIIIMLTVLLTQIIIVYKGGGIFRTYGLTKEELIIVTILALTIIPVDWLRKLYIKKAIPK